MTRDNLWYRLGYQRTLGVARRPAEQFVERDCRSHNAFQR